jgi:pSer/pThr/pTyr-binding forkhead associated (FHA) protein
MGRQLHELFLASCGLFGQWGIRIFRTENAVEECTLTCPYAVVGKRDNVGLLLPGPELSRRHAYLQVLPGGLFCIDLDSRAGVLWGDEKRFSGWLRPGQRVHLGPYALELLPNYQDGWLDPSNWPRGDPLSDRISDAVPLPSFVVEVAEAGKVRAWGRMNRVLALVGRSPRCLFHINDPALSKFHCSLVRTPMGLWLVDLLSRLGTNLNGRPVRCGRVHEGDLVQLGRFSLRFWHPARNAKITRGVAAVTVEPREGNGSRSTIDLLPAPPENKQLTVPCDEPSTALEPVRAADAVPAPVAPRSARTVVAAPDERVGAEWSMLIALVNQFNLMQQQMFDQFQESMLITSRMFTSLHQDQMALVREELDQLRGLTGELHAIQGELIGQRANANSPLGAGPGGRRVEPVGGAGSEFLPNGGGSGGTKGWTVTSREATPSPTEPSEKPPDDYAHAASVAGAAAGSPEDVHAWLNQRISAIQEERQTRWHKLLGMILGN